VIVAWRLARMTGFTTRTAAVHAGGPRVSSRPAVGRSWRMGFLDRLRHALRIDHDALADRRDGIARVLSLPAALLMAPFTLSHLLAGRWVLGLIDLAAQAALVINAWYLARQRPAPVPFLVLALALLAAVCESILRLGVVGTYWAYPAMLVSYFVMGRASALVFTAVTLTCCTAIAWLELGPPVAARLGASLLLTAMMINVVLNTLSDLQQALVQQTLTDPLTGAYNRRHLAQQITQLTRPGPDIYGMNALLAIDVDHFKSINDRHGHAAGDAVLVACVQALSARKRQSDMLFRTGGEEFVLLLPRTSALDAHQVAESLRRRIAETPLLPGHPITVSIGVGIQQPQHSPDDWLGAADRALYQAKHNGRNRVELSA
jgi:diguanylate cyclase (GGDEF)-like protein